MNFKIQVLNGFKMYSDQITSVFKTRYDGEEKIDLDQLSNITGLNRRKARLILNYLADIKLSEKRTLNKSTIGELIYRNDEFFQNEGTLWLLHYFQATNKYLVIWNRTMNKLYEYSRISREEILAEFEDLEECFSEYTYKHHITQEVRIIMDAYINQNFKRLNILEEENGEYRINKNQDIPILILLASILLYRDTNYPGATAISISELSTQFNSPGRIFIMDDHTFRNKLEELKKLDLISVESRADLDQVRIKEEQTFEGVLAKYYKE